MINIRKLESELWESADLLRQGSKLTSNEYCMPVLGLIFLRYAYSRFKYVEAEIMKDRPVRNGRVLPVEPEDFAQKSAIFLPEKARYDYLLNLPDGTDVGKAVNEAMELVESQSAQLKGVLPKTYTSFQNDLLRELLRIFNNSALNEIHDDIIGRIYEYFLNKFAPAVASDDGVFFTPKSLVRMIVNIIEPTHGTVLDPACGSGGMFVSSSDFVERYGTNANSAMTFFGQEKVDYNGKLCLMNMAVHGLNAKIIYGEDGANSFYNDYFNLDGCCDYVMANPPFNVDKVNSESTQNAGRLPFGLPGVNANKEVSNANYLWISYFYSYLNETGRAGFVMAASATDSSNKDRLIRQQLVRTGHVDVMLSVGNNFFYTKSLPCTLWFFDKGKPETRLDQVLFIDSRNYYTAVDKTLNEWSEWQMKNLNAVVWLYRGETEKYTALLDTYESAIHEGILNWVSQTQELSAVLPKQFAALIDKVAEQARTTSTSRQNGNWEVLRDTLDTFRKASDDAEGQTIKYAETMDNAERKELAAANGFKTYRAYEKRLEILAALSAQMVEDCRKIIHEAMWLTEKFGDGVYAVIPGLCKIADRAEIESKNWSLTPGAYVGVAEVEADDTDFTERMIEIHKELLTLQTQANELMKTISENFEGMGL